MEALFHSKRRDRGFTLVEIVVVILIFSIVLAMATVIVRAVTASQKRSITASRMAAIDAALAQFVAVQKRLPCPADGTRPGSDASAGTETARDATGCTAQQNGVVPWRALGLAEQDAVDGWNNRFMYRVPGTLGADGGMDMSKCDPAGPETGTPTSACNPACASTALASCTAPKDFLMAKGWEIHTISTAPVVKVMDPNGNPPTGAAYVVISHGESAGGAYNTNGAIQSGTTVDGDEEKKNYANAPVAGYYVDDSIFDNPGAATHFDDIVSRPSVMTVVSKAGLGPRSH